MYPGLSQCCKLFYTIVIFEKTLLAIFTVYYCTLLTPLSGNGYKSYSKCFIVYVCVYALLSGGKKDIEENVLLKQTADTEQNKAV